MSNAGIQMLYEQRIITKITEIRRIKSNTVSVLMESSAPASGEWRENPERKHSISKVWFKKRLEELEGLDRC